MGSNQKIGRGGTFGGGRERNMGGEKTHTQKQQQQHVLNKVKVNNSKHILGGTNS